MIGKTDQANHQYDLQYFWQAAEAGYLPAVSFILLVISPYARQNFVDNTMTDQTSILRFIEDNWQLGRIGDQSFDAISGTLTNMFDFKGNPAPKLFLDPSTGEQVQASGNA